jgi:hypothetical protein
MFCRITVLPVRGGATISARWPLPIGATMSMTRRERSLGRIFDFHASALFGRIERRKVVEMDLMAGGVRILEVDAADLQQCEVAFAILRAADLALYGVSGAKCEAADLRRADVDVVRPGR